MKTAPTENIWNIANECIEFQNRPLIRLRQLGFEWLKKTFPNGVSKNRVEARKQARKQYADFLIEKAKEILSTPSLTEAQMKELKINNLDNWVETGKINL